MIGAPLTALQLVLGTGSLTLGGWWTVLNAIAIPAARERRGDAGLRFVVIVPAHDEERLVAATVRSLLASHYSPAPEVLVVADNCGDATAAEAANAGARVIERSDPARRGKSFALDFAISHLRGREAGAPDVVVVVDADTTVSSGFFAAMSDGVRRARVAQARYDAAPSTSDVGRLRRLAFGLVHHARPLGARRLGLPTTLKGNGMAFRWEVVRDGMPGSGITEDAAATLDLAARGVTVRYVPAGQVTGLMAEGYRDAKTQDARWEGGRFALMPRALGLVGRQAVRGRMGPAAAAAELASPPLTLTVGAAAIALALGLLGFGANWLGVVAAGSMVSYVALGLVATRAEMSDVRALLHAPRFVVHKLVSLASVVRSRPAAWERTNRG